MPHESVGFKGDQETFRLMTGLDDSPVLPPPIEPPTPPGPGLLRADHWHLKTFIDNALIIDAPDAYFFSKPDNGFNWPPNWLVDAATAGYRFNPIWGATPVDTVWGPYFSGGEYWYPWWKNIYWDGELLNAMQGANILPFVDTLGSHLVRNYTYGTGKAMRAGYQDSTANLTDSDYQRNGIGTTWIAQYDVSSAGIGQGNAHMNGMSFVVPSMGWTPWGGERSQYYTPFQTLFLPLIDGADNNVWQWSLMGGIFNINDGPGGDFTTGPGFSTTMSKDDTNFYTIKWEVTYNGHDYVELQPGIGNPYVGV